MAMPDADPVIAIVGTGFSGTLLACQLLKQTQRPLHLLNVSAGAMSA